MAIHGSRKRTAAVQFPLRAFVIIPLSVIAYATVLHWVYFNLVTNTFSYLGYGYKPPVPQVVVVSVMATACVAVCLPKRITKPSTVVLWGLFVIAVAPGMLMAQYVGYLTTLQALLASVSVGASFLIAVFGLKWRKPAEPLRLHVSPSSFWLIVGLFSALTYGVMALSVGLSLRFVSILDVYDVREDYAAGLSGAGILGYLVSTQANVVNPLIIARGIYSRRWALVLVGCFGQALLFSGTGFKTVLFSFPALVIVALIFRMNLRPNALLLLWGAVSLMICAAIADALQDSNLWTSLFSRRFLFTPGLLLSVYIKFFSDNPVTALGHSVLGPWVDYPYEFSPPRVIGLATIGSSQTAMNANLFADGFANFGYVGMAGAGIVLLLYLRILDRAAYGLPVAVSALVILMPMIALSNSGILTAMFSHGLVVAVIALAVAPRGNWGNKPPSRPPKLAKSKARLATLS